MKKSEIMDLKTTITRNLEMFRKERNLTLEDVADIMNIEHSLYADYERGIKFITVPHLVLISRLYKVSVEDLLKGFEYEPY
ncbi:MAG: helix-turn-helix transcriptional regulator [Clostridiales bacterium]|nr:helix-turn-helix transcriptional regulator [Clostridiales bacterium]